MTTLFTEWRPAPDDRPSQARFAPPPPLDETRAPATGRFPAEDAGPGLRLGGAIIDALAVYGPIAVASVLAPNGDARAVAVWALYWIAVAANLLLAATRGQSIGKAVVGTRIVRAADGQKAEWWRVIFLRALLPGLLFAIPFVGIVFALIDAVSILRGDNRCFHDDFARTRVIKLR